MNYEELLHTAVEAAVAGGVEIMKVYGETDFQVSHKADASPLTIADQRAHNAIEALLKTTPFPILSEEGNAVPFEQRSLWTKFWMVDPLDGTKEFIKRNGEFTVNIALIEDGIPTIGVIYVPVKAQLYFGALHIGAHRKTIATTHDLQQPLLDGSLQLPINKTEQLTVVGSRSHLSDATEDFITRLESLHGPTDFASMGSSLKICLVAEGSADVYPRYAPTMEWDTAAGHGIALAAGCECVRADDRTPLVYNKENLLNPFFIVSNKRFELPII